MTNIKQQASAKALKQLPAMLPYGNRKEQHTLPADLFDVEASVDEQQRRPTSVRLKRGFYLLKGEGVER